MINKENSLVFIPNAKVTISRVFTFDSAHHLIDYNGPCGNEHGHTYSLEVFITGSLDEQGFVCDYNEMKEIVQTNIIKITDHSNLNFRFDFNTTAENLVVFIFHALLGPFNIRKLKLMKVKLWETANSCAEYSGGNIYE